MTPFRGRRDRCTLRGATMDSPCFPREPDGIPCPSTANRSRAREGRLRGLLRRFSFALGIALGTLGTGGCERSASEAPADPPASARIVSLSPAMTTMLIDIGAKDDLAGRTPWCRGVDDLPVVGTLEGVDAEVLVAIAPTIVVHQPPATGVDPVLEGLRRRMGFELVGGRMDGVEDIDRTLGRFGAHGLGDRASIADWRRRLARTFGGGDVGVDNASPPRTVIVHAVDPFGVAGTDTYLHDVLLAAGGVNAIEEPGWRTIGAEAMLASSPEVVLVVGGVTVDDMAARLEGLGWSGPPRILTFEDPSAMEPSTRVCDVVDAVRILLRDDRGAEATP